MAVRKKTAKPRAKPRTKARAKDVRATRDEARRAPEADAPPEAPRRPALRPPGHPGMREQALTGSKRRPAATKRRIADDLLRPGPHVGEATSADDRLPEQFLRRGQTLKESARGRTEPRRYKTRSQRRRTQDAGGYRPTAARAKPPR
jgi:hypothetical protein